MPNLWVKYSAIVYVASAKSYLDHFSTRNPREAIYYYFNIEYNFLSFFLNVIWHMYVLTVYIITII